MIEDARQFQHFMRGIIHPVVQFPAEPLKTEISRTPSHPGINGAGTVRIRHGLPGELALGASPWALERAAVEAVFAARNPADSVRTDRGAR